VAKFIPAPKLKHLKIGFWDYGNYVLKKVHPELIKLWKRAGANCIFKMLEGVDPKDFTLYAGLHHSYFKTASFPTYRPDGTISGKELDGWYFRKHKLSEMLPKITCLQLENVRKTGWTGMDYEPSGNAMGFIPGSIADFQKEYGVSKTEFETMRRGLVTKGYGYHAAASPSERKIYYKWNEYQSKLYVEFIKALAVDLKKANPEAKIYNCTQDGLAVPDIRGSGLCVDDSLQCKYLDMLVPQIYSGYNEIAAKYAVIRSREWYQRIQKINPQCILHSLLLIRYANGKIRNSPQWLRQQTIGSFAEGARGVSYYFIQDFNATDWAELAETVKQLAMVEDFYVGGKRCDEEFKIYGAPERVGYHPIWPGGKREINNPDWHMTAHQQGRRILVTFFNYNAKNDLTVKLESKHVFEKIDHGKQNVDGSFLIPKNQTAYLFFQAK
ncbi:MAG: hypothetical protein J5858_10140, partial [Lentisphaeria bacterium]|nr:hypothetical protein [Lentisphaeria bacterium]